MTINRLQMINLAPRGIRGTCVPTSLRFVTGADYIDIEEVLVREQPKNYRPDIKGNRGVDSWKLLGRQRTLFGHRFTKLMPTIPAVRLGQVPSRFGHATYLVTVPSHMLVVKDGQIFDLADTKLSAPVHEMWKVEKVS